MEGREEYRQDWKKQWMRQDEEGRWIKYCRTCHLWRPPRASHCNVCGFCMVRKQVSHSRLAQACSFRIFSLFH